MARIACFRFVQSLDGVYRFLDRHDATARSIRTLLVVRPEPAGGRVLHLLNRVEQRLGIPFGCSARRRRSVVACTAGQGRSGCRDAQPRSVGHRCVLRAFVSADHFGLVMSFEDLLQRPDHECLVSRPSRYCSNSSSCPAESCSCIRSRMTDSSRARSSVEGCRNIRAG